MRGKAGLRCAREHQVRDPRVSDLQASQDHPRPSRAHRLRSPARRGTAPRRGRGPRRSQCSLLHPPGARRHQRRVRRRPRSARARAAARRRRTGAPVRSRPRGRVDGQGAPSVSAEADPARRAALLDAITGAPALIQNGRLDIVGANQLARALYSELFRDPARPANHARFNFLNPTAHDLYPDWERGADDAVALLRAEAGRDPYDRDLTDLIGELSTRSEEFRARWADHNVRLHQTGAKRFHHPVVGELTLTFEMMELAGDPGLNLLTFTPEPGTKSHEALNLLGSWAATLEQEQTAPTAGEA
jgi:hypothetical protein